MTRESKILIAVLVLIVGAMVGVFLLANGSGSTNNPKGDKTALTRPDTYKQGTGSVQVVEYGDYQCPACGAAYPVVKQLQQDLPGQFTLYFRNFPLTQLHANAMLAANAAEAAGAQGKYWEMHDKLYESQKDWSNLAAGDAEAKLVGYAKDLGLDADKFKQAVDSTQYQSRIDQDVADGTAQSVQATPTFFVNGHPVSTNTYPALRDAILTAAGQPTPSATASPEASASPSPVQ